MLISLFGGAVVIILLFYGLRALRVPNYWCAVVSAALPLAGYSLYAALSQPAIDIAAMHITVYLSTAFALGLINSQARVGGSKLHWGPKLFIGFFVVLFILLGAFAYIATNGLPDAIARRIMPGGREGGAHTAFAGVVPHGEDAAKGISQHLKQQQKQHELGWNVDVQGLNALALNTVTPVEVRLRDAAGLPIADAQLRLVLTRPAQRDADIIADFSSIAPGLYRAELRLDAPGQWHSLLQIKRGDTSLDLEQAVISISAP